MFMAFAMVYVCVYFSDNKTIMLSSHCNKKQYKNKWVDSQN